MAPEFKSLSHLFVPGVSTISMSFLFVSWFQSVYRLAVDVINETVFVTIGALSSEGAVQHTSYLSESFCFNVILPDCNTRTSSCQQVRG